MIYAGRLERLFAYLIDSIILVLPGMLLVGLLGESGILTAITFAISMFYYTYFTASNWQATPGKRLLGMYVARCDRQPLTLRDAVERFLAFCLPSLPIYASVIPENVAPMIVFWLSLAWFCPILFTPERIGMHDRLCRTRVLVGKVGG